MTDAIQDRILQAIYRLSRDTCPIDATILGQITGVSATAAAEALVALEQAGLVDASRARLTMLGLARACALASDLGGTQPAPAVEAAQRPRQGSARKVPLAARSAAGETARSAAGETARSAAGETASAAGETAPQMEARDVAGTGLGYALEAHVSA